MTAQTENKEIKTDFARVIKERRDFAIREQKAQEYSDLCELKRIANEKRKEIIKEKTMIVIMGVLFITVAGIKFASNANEIKNEEMQNKAITSETNQITLVDTFSRADVDKTGIEVKQITSEMSNEEAFEILSNRNGALVVEVVEGTVLNENGDGEYCYKDDRYYIHYNPKLYSNGDEVVSVFVYNPNTNYEDDILYRTDYKK